MKVDAGKDHSGGTQQGSLMYLSLKGVLERGKQGEAGTVTGCPCRRGRRISSQSPPLVPTSKNARIKTFGTDILILKMAIDVSKCGSDVWDPHLWRMLTFRNCLLKIKELDELSLTQSLLSWKLFFSKRFHFLQFFRIFKEEMVKLFLFRPYPEWNHP